MLPAGALTPGQRATLELFARTVGCYVMQSPAARAARAESMAIEGRLEAARNSLALGATLEGEGFVEMSSVALRSRMRVDADEATREACWTGLRGIGESSSSSSSSPSSSSSHFNVIER